MSQYQVVIGRFEYIDVINHAKLVPAKVDSGAYRSAIHATDVEVINRKGIEVLRFKILGHPVYQESTQLESKSFSKRKVRNSTGGLTERYEVKLRIKLGYKTFKTSFTLVNRADNIFPVLIGRTALNKRFLVDTDKAGVNRDKLRQAAAQVPEDKEFLEGVSR